MWPAPIFLVGAPLNWYLARKVRMSGAERGVRPPFRKDLLICWLGIVLIGFLWTAGVGISAAGQWYLIPYIWGSLYFIGYVMNGVLLSSEWFWAAGILVVSLVASFLAGAEEFCWVPGVWQGGTLLVAGLLGRRGARRYAALA